MQRSGGKGRTKSYNPRSVREPCPRENSLTLHGKGRAVGILRLRAKDSDRRRIFAGASLRMTGVGRRFKLARYIKGCAFVNLDQLTRMLTQDMYYDFNRA